MERLVPRAAKILHLEGFAQRRVVDGQRLAFTQQSQPWAPCARVNAPSAQSIGVSLSYRYHLITPISVMFSIFGPGAGTLPMTDGTVMALNP